MEALFILGLIIKNWWWFFLPIILFFPAKFFYFWWIKWEVWYKRNKWILIEVKPPKEILKPFRAMEDIFTIVWGIVDGPNWKERWCEGEMTEGPYWISWEIVSIGGKIHFFIRILAEWRDMVESTIYSQYPEAEISEVDDYTKDISQDTLNEEWNIYSEDFSLWFEDSYPIKTYPMFFEEKPEVIKEEKRLDPMDSLLEALSRLTPDEQFWLQIVTAPVLPDDVPWMAKGRALADKLAKRPEPTKAKPIVEEAAEILISGPQEEKEEKQEIIPPEFKLTPGEREVLAAVENKITKPGYKTWIRIVYLSRKNAPRLGGNHKIGRSYFNQFMTENLNILVFYGPTRTKIHWWLRERRLYLRKRKQFKSYIERLPSSFPRTMSGEPTFSFSLPFKLPPRGPGIRGTIILNTEELATIYHFPAKIITPALPYVEAKKGGPPPTLPTE